MKKNRWKRTVPKRSEENKVPGLYRASISSGRSIFSYGDSAQDAARRASMGLRDREHILSIGRERE